MIITGSKDAIVLRESALPNPYKNNNPAKKRTGLHREIQLRESRIRCIIYR